MMVRWEAKHLWRSIFRDADWLTAERILHITVIYAVARLLLFVVELWLHTKPEISEIINWPLGEDFTNFWSGAQLAFHGHPKTVYDFAQFLQFEQAHTRPFSQFRWYAYPPVTLLLTAPLIAFSYLPGYVFWLLAGTGLCFFLFSRALSWQLALLATIAMPATFYNAIAGQNGQFTAALLAGGILLLDRRPIIAGILFGMLSYKPQLGILLPFVLLAGRHWRCLLSAIAAVIVLCAVTTALFGMEIWAEYLKVAPLNRMIMELGRIPDMGLGIYREGSFWHRLPTVFSALRSAGMAPLWAYIGQGISSAIALLMTLTVWRGKADQKIKGAVLIIGTFLATPYAWDYDMIVLGFAVVWLWQDGVRTGFFPWEKFVLASALAMTACSATVGRHTGIIIAPIFLWMVFWFATKRALEPDVQRSATQPVRLAGSWRSTQT
jgi:arabinofuranan 3-O-arabinosyltransferase